MDEELKTKGWLQIDFAIEFTRWSIRGMVYLFERHARQYETLSPIDMPRRIEWLGGNERIARINLFFFFLQHWQLPVEIATVYHPPTFNLIFSILLTPTTFMSSLIGIWIGFKFMSVLV